ncbi:hypothetical protein COU20_00885 [Candidatus Kaiserbacteria bacterium CG10_big_fil_rev_8_21_14_0_10_59_10]|uniref:Uncharacterized protein n=1 Tax=Candidatus Kaiserbacteria bacterium CG10_big_fil_rev_8_21_14_0_10_59_10 TaxID=1974612 RepID=A0A2H0U8I3_9BACT|nr:MAG: hypothetical protein COU20_00885 [Candidatus Kaiserbacteria bacterium CG10_big_fil_rev_8_21_14_0_10_59_10]
MIPYRDSWLVRLAILAFFALAIGYAYFEARGMLFGPSIAVPSEVLTTGEQYTVIRGKAERIAELRLNGMVIPVTEEGEFEEPYLLARGVNRLVLDAVDKYGQNKRRVVTIVYAPSGATPVSPRATPSREADDASSTPEALAPGT